MIVLVALCITRILYIYFLSWILLRFVFADMCVALFSFGLICVHHTHAVRTAAVTKVVGVLHTVQAFAPYLKANTTKPSIICTTASK